MKKNNDFGQAGFTIIELMIATLVFSVILLLVTFGLLQVTRTYYKGVTSSKTQQTARAVMDQITQGIQFSGGQVATSITPASGSQGFCIGDQRYSFRPDSELIENSPNGSNNQAYHALVVDTLTGCSAASARVLNTQTLGPPGTNPRELLSPNMRLNNLAVTSLGNNLYKVDVTVVYGDNDLLNASHDQCASFSSGTQFCAVSTLSTVVQKRLK